ncbi:MAG: YifB family Mg chelatase-like AAA ATPase [Oligoflexus sp.]
MKEASQVKSAMIMKNHTQMVTLEACIGRGFSGIQMLGNLGETCKEARDRAKTALENLGLQLTQKKVLINLSPAHIKKEGNHFDLAIAVLLAQLHQKTPRQIAWNRWAFIGELDLQGTIKPVTGCTAMILGLLKCQLEGIVIPRANLAELISLKPILSQSRIRIIGFDSITDLLQWSDPHEIPDASEANLLKINGLTTPNFDDMMLSDDLRRLIVCVMAGRHHLLLSGTPGCGKSMFAERLACLMQPLSMEAFLDVLQIYGLSQERLPPKILAAWPPYRSPHHSLSQQALLGTPERAGEVSLAHHGILFLDEFPEFRRDAVEALREPLETGMIHVSRAKEKASWPAKPQVIAACNLCPCGWHGSRSEICRCSTQQLLRYQSKLSGPIMDRIDIHFLMPDNRPIQWQECSAHSGQTENLRQWIRRTEEISLKRNQGFGLRWNRQLSLQQFPAASGLSQDEFTKLLNRCAFKASSRRSVLKILRVARTLADCEQSEVVKQQHLQQAWKWHRPIRPLDDSF